MGLWVFLFCLSVGDPQIILNVNFMILLKKLFVQSIILHYMKFNKIQKTLWIRK